MIEGTLNLATSKSQEKGVAGPDKQKCGSVLWVSKPPGKGLAVEHDQVQDAQPELLKRGLLTNASITRQQVSQPSSGERGNRTCRPVYP